MTSFSSKTRKAFSGKALVVVRAVKGKAGIIRVTAQGDGLVPVTAEVRSK